MKLNEDLIQNVLKDWEKRRISPQVKSSFIKGVLEQENISERELARRLCISHSTLHDWVSMRQQEKETGIKAYPIDSLLDRLLFIMSRKEFLPTDKTKRLIKELKKELERIEL